MKRRKILSYVIVIIIAAVAAGWFSLSGSWLHPAKAQLADGSVKFIHSSISGVVPGQIVRITVGNLSGRESRPIVLQTKFFDQNGTLVFESARTEVPAGGFGKLDVLHGGLGMDTEAGTERKQFRLQVEIQGRSVSPLEALINAEILNEDTGSTVLDLELTLISNYNSGG
jgi:hypothetical protein